MALYPLALQDFQNSTKELLYGAIAQTFTSPEDARVVQITVPLYRENKSGYSGTVTMQILKTTSNYRPSTDPNDILYSQEYAISLLWGFPSDTVFVLTNYIEIQKSKIYAVVFWWDGRYGPGGSDDRKIFWDYKNTGGASGQARYVYNTTEERWEPDPAGGVYRFRVDGHRKPKVLAVDPVSGHTGIYKKNRVFVAFFSNSVNHVFYVNGNAYNGVYSSSAFDWCVLPGYLSPGNYSWYIRHSSIDDTDWTLNSDVYFFRVIDTPLLPDRELLAGDITSDKTATTSVSWLETRATLFTAVAGIVSHVRLSLARSRTFLPLEGEGLKIEIRTVNENNRMPSDTVLATAEYPAYPMSILPPGAFDAASVLVDLDAELDNAVELEDGKTYALVYSIKNDASIHFGLITKESPWDRQGQYFFDGQGWVLDENLATLNTEKPKWLTLFYVNRDIDIVFVRLAIGKDGQSPTCNMRAEIYSVENGALVGSALASAVIDTEELPGDSANFYTFALNNLLTLGEGRYYALVLTLESPQPNDVIYWDGSFYASTDDEILQYNQWDDIWSHYSYGLLWAGIMGEATFTPAKPKAVFPADNQINVEDWPLILEWECDKDPDEYRVYFRQTPFGGGYLEDGFNSHLIGVLKRNGSEPVPTYLVLPDYIENIFTKWPQANTQFSWKVVAIWHFEDGDVVSEELPIPYANQWNFRTPPYGTGTGIYYLNLPINPTPQHESTSVNTRTENATWENGGGALRYDVYFGTRDYYLAHDGVLPKVASNVPDASKILSLRSQSLEYGTTYLWRVNPKNNVFERDGTLWEFETTVVGSGTGVPFPDGYYAKFIKRLIIAADDRIWYEDE